MLRATIACVLACATTMSMPGLAAADEGHGHGDLPDGQPRLGMRDLERGHTGADVRELQRTLTRLRLSVSVSGTFNRATEDRVRQYERRVRIKVDGKVSRGR